MVDNNEPDWAKIASKIGRDMRSADERSPTLSNVIARGIRFLKVDKNSEQLVFDTRALFLGFLGAGLEDRASMRYGNTASWFCDWLGRRLGSTAVLAGVLPKQMSSPEDIFAGLHSGFDPVLSQSVTGLIDPAADLSKQTISAEAFEARHLFGAMIVRGVLADQVRELYNVDLSPDDVAALKSEFIERVMATPGPLETRESWARALALDVAETSAEVAPAVSSQATSMHEEMAQRAIDSLLRRHGIANVTLLARQILETAAVLYQARTETAEITTTRLFLAGLEIGARVPRPPAMESAGVSALHQLSEGDARFSELSEIEPDYTTKLRRTAIDVPVIDASPNVVEILQHAAGILSTDFGHEGTLGADSLMAALLRQADMNLEKRLRAKNISLQMLCSAVLDNISKTDQTIYVAWASALGGVTELPASGPEQIDRVVDVIGVDDEPTVGVSFANLGNDSPDRAYLDDKLDTLDEARAFARIAAARQVTPPIAFGIFGDWGSGKSFFMRLMQQHVEKLSRKEADEAKTGALFHERIVSIRFNAWHYSESNLWASLVDNIFIELDRWLREKGAVKKPNALLDKLATARELTLESAERLMSQRELQKLASQRLADAEQELALKRKSAGASPRVFWNAVSQTMTAAFAEKEFKQATSKLGLDQLASDAEALKGTLDSLKDEAKRARVVTNGLFNRLLSAPYLLFSLVVIVGIPSLSAYFYDHLQSGSWAPFVSKINIVVLQVGATLTSAGGLLAYALSRVRSSVAKLESYRAKLECAIDDEVKSPKAEVAKAEEELAKLTANVVEAKALLAVSSDQLAAATKDYEYETGNGRLLRFVHDRAGDGEYAKHLGLIATIRKDFTELSAMMEGKDAGVQREFKRQIKAHEKRVASLIAAAEKRDLLTAEEKAKLLLIAEQPRPVPAENFERIILYIDDLDRCPPDKVVQVLQAVHLLLTFPLFVVVVAVDSRWVRHSLEAHYLDLLSAGNTQGDGDTASSSDYLEKIFQIPYWVRPMTKDSSIALLKSLAQPLADAPPLAEDDMEENDQKDVGQEDETAEKPVDDTPANDRPNGDTPIDPSPEAAQADSIEQPQPSSEAQAVAVVAINQDEGGRAEQSQTVAARALALSPAELAFIEKIAPWVGRTPRRALRFLNTYRVIKASLCYADLRALEAGGYYGLMTQLAIVIGCPTLHSIWLQELGQTTEASGATEFQAQLLKACDGKPDSDLLFGALAVFMAEATSSADPLSRLKKYSAVAKRYGFAR